MSFLGYIGKTLGAGTAPIVNANAAAQSDIQYREFRENAPNRAELARIAMEQARRAEQIAKDKEAERQRGQQYIIQNRREAGLPTPSMAVTPDISETAPTTLQPTPQPTLPAVGLSTSTAPTAPAVSPKGDFTANDIRTADVLGSTPSKYSPLAERTLQFLFGRIPDRNEALSLITKGIESLDKQINSKMPRTRALKTEGPTPDVLPLLEQRERLFALRDELKPEQERKFLGQKLGPTTRPIPTGLAAPVATAAPAAAPPPAAGLAAPVAVPAAPAVTPAVAAPPAAGGPADLRPTGASLAPAALAGYEQFRPAVETVAPTLGFDVGEANTLMAGLGYGESRFNVNAKSPSGTYTGAYQLGPALVKQYGPRVQQRFGYNPASPEGQAAMTLMFAADNKKTLAAKGVATTPENLALAHNQGATGAAALLQNPSMPVAEALDKFAPERNSGAKRAGGQAWMKGVDVSKTTAGEFVERASAYYGKYSPEFSNVKTSPINPEVYIADPKGLTFGMQQAEFFFNLTQQQRNDTLNLIDASDPFSATTQQQLADAYTLTQRLVQQSGVYAQLQITKGLTSAFGGDTSYLNGVLSGIMNYPIEVRATAGEQGIDYQVTAGGQPVSDFLDYDGMKQFVMRIADSEYDAELTALEIAAAAKANEITLQLSADVQKILAQGNVNRALSQFAGEKDKLLAKLNADLEKAGQGLKLTKLADGPNGEPLVTDELGRVYQVKTSKRNIGPNKVDITSLELVDVEGLSE